MPFTLDEVRDALLEALEREAPAHDVDIVDVEVVGASKAPTVRVRIDHADEQADPISLDEVSAETAWISDLVDELDPIAGRFTLEVSSPGMARPLRKERDFERFAGSTVSLKLKGSEGRRRYTGTLTGIEEGVVGLENEEGSFSWQLDEIQSCSIKPDFGDANKKEKGRAKRGQRR